MSNFERLYRIFMRYGNYIVTHNKPRYLYHHIHLIFCRSWDKNLTDQQICDKMINRLGRFMAHTPKLSRDILILLTFLKKYYAISIR